MGMAASQARYLALVARKSNCEFEGQQINQARTVLSNQSANLFNQMLGLKVPVPPSVQDFTKTQYSYKDGLNESAISDWQQLSNDPDYNYVVTHYYYTDRYTGAQKKMTDPQVQFNADAADLSQIEAAGMLADDSKAKLQKAKEDYEDAKNTYETWSANLANARRSASNLENYASSLENISKCEVDNTTGQYTITQTDKSTDPATDTTSIFEAYDPATASADVKELVEKLISEGAFPESYNTQADSLLFSRGADGKITLTSKSDLTKLAISGDTLNDAKLTVYTQDNITAKTDEYDAQISTLEAQEALITSMYKTAEQTLELAQASYDEALENYANLNHPQYIGNSPLSPLGTLTADQEAEIRQIIADMKEQGISTNIEKHLDENGNYNGGIYSFKLNGIVYYAAYEDLQASYTSGTGPNNIDGQTKLPYYNASFVSTKIEETNKAVVETDGSGRFTSIRFEDDSMVYTLNMETVSDDVAYQDAMNQYYYDNAIYDKTIRDINAKTSIIQQQDQQLELRLKQLDTEQNALSTEMEAVKKVVTDNVESSFKTFGG